MIESWMIQVERSMNYFCEIVCIRGGAKLIVDNKQLLLSILNLFNHLVDKLLSFLRSSAHHPSWTENEMLREIFFNELLPSIFRLPIDTQWIRKIIIGVFFLFTIKNARSRNVDHRNVKFMAEQSNILGS